MLKTFFATLSPMLTVFLFIIVGYITVKLKVLPDITPSILSKLENNVLVPALILNTFIKYCTMKSIKDNYLIFIVSISVLAVAAVLSFLLSGMFSKDPYKKNIFRYAFIFANYGFMSNAIVPVLFGEEMLYYYMLFTLPLNTACYSAGINLLMPKGKAEKKRNPLLALCNPMMISIVAGIVLGLTGAERIIPKFIMGAVSSAGNCMGPIAMLLTGMVIAGFKLPDLLTDKKVYIATALRLILIPAAFLAVLILLKVPENIVHFALFAYATPFGLNTIVFPAAYGEDTLPGASMAVVSHTLCVVTIPLLYAAVSVFI